MTDDGPTITRNDAAGRFEVEGRPDAGHLRFSRSGDRIVLEHTEVADDLEGEGIGSALVRTALDHAEAEGLTIVPECRFVQGWLKRHPDRAAELDIAEV